MSNNRSQGLYLDSNKRESLLTSSQQMDDEENELIASAPTSPPSHRAQNDYQVKLRKIDGHVLTLNFPSIEGVKVSDLKNQAEDQYSIPSAVARLIFSGREITDDQLLSDLSIDSGSMIHLVLRQAETSNTDTLNADGLPSSGHYGIPVSNIAPISTESQFRLTQTFKLARQLKLVILMDILFLLLWTANEDDVTMILTLISATLAIAAIVGVHKFNLTLSIVTMIFPLVCIAVRIYLIVSFRGAESLIVSFSGFLLDFSLLWYTPVFLRSLATLTPQEHAELQLFNDPNYGMANGY